MRPRCPFCKHRLFHFVVTDRKTVVPGLMLLVARTLAQQFSQQLDAACHPHQYAPSTRIKAEALLHTLQAKTQADPHHTSRPCPLTSRRLMTLLAGRPCCLHCARCRKLRPWCRVCASCTFASLCASGLLVRRRNASPKLKVANTVMRSCVRVASCGRRTCPTRAAPQGTWTSQRRAPCRRCLLGILSRCSPGLREPRPRLRSSPRCLEGPGRCPTPQPPYRTMHFVRCPLQRLRAAPPILHMGGNAQPHAQVMSFATEA